MGESSSNFLASTGGLNDYQSLRVQSTKMRGAWGFHIRNRNDGRGQIPSTWVLGPVRNMCTYIMLMQVYFMYRKTMKVYGTTILVAAEAP